MSRPSVVCFLKSYQALFIALVLNTTLSFGQLTQPRRFEASHHSGDFNYTVLSLKEKGIALMRQIDKYKGGSNFWEVTFLDTALQKSWSSEIELDNQLNLIGFDYINEEVFFLYRQGSGDLGPLHLIQIKTTDNSITSYEIETKLDFKLTYFNIVGRSAVMAGYVSRTPTVFMHELTTRRSKVVPGFFMKNTELLDIRTNLNNTFNTLILDKSSTEKKQLVIKTLDESGAVIVDDVVDVPSDKSVLSGVTSTLLRDELLVTGTWGQPNGKTALGVYTLLVDPFNKQSIQYYNFSDFQHFLDFNSTRKAARIKAKTAKRKEAGKLPSFGVYVNPARLVEHDDGFILLLEVYSPNSTSNSSFGPGYGSQSAYASGLYGYGYSPYNFNSYSPRYTPYGYGNPNHRSDVTVKFASVALINSHGKLLEDTGMKVQDVKLQSIDQVSDFICTPQKLIQLYRNDKVLNMSTTMRQEEMAISAINTPIGLLHPNDILKNDESDEGALRHWYDNIFFVWGYETVKQKEADTRNVFYVNKIKVY